MYVCARIHVPAAMMAAHADTRIYESALDREWALIFIGPIIRRAGKANRI